jgi:hypothetical protein
MARTTVEARAIKFYGTTQSVFNAGYLLQDGTMLDFSEGGNEGRCTDHRNISYFYNYDPSEYAIRTKIMVRFMSRGNIRVMPESGSIELVKKPTKYQMSVIREIAKDFERSGRELVIEKTTDIKFGGVNSEIIGDYRDLIQWMDR